MTPAYLHRGEERPLDRLLLSPLVLPEALYRLALRKRARRFASGRLARTRAAVPVISVGNLAVGGAGKTPIVLHLAERLLQRGRRVAILSLGYGRKERAPRRVGPDDDAAAAGDEPLLLARRCPEARVYVGRRRDLLAERAVEEGAEILLLDDGFQYLALERDLDLVVLDGGSPLGNGRLLPRGPLREAPAALARADLCWLSKVDEGGGDSVEAAARLAHAQTGAWPIRSRYRVAGLFRADLKSPVGAHEGRGAPVFLFAGLARPTSFTKSVASLGLEIAGQVNFADHRHFTRRELGALFRAAEQAGARHLICTEKDAVRLPASLRRDPRLWVLRIEVEILEGEDRLEAALDRLAARRAA